MSNFNINENNDYSQNNNYFNNYNERTYVEQTEKLSKNKFTVSGSKILVQSLLWFGLGFLLVAGLGSLWTYLLTKDLENILDIYDSTSFYVMYSMLGVSLIGSIIFSFFSPVRRRGQGLGMAIFAFIFYVLMFSMIFSTASISISLLDNSINYYLILVAFGITGFLTLLCGLIAAGLTAKGALTLGKMIAILFGVVLVGNLIVCFFFWNFEVTYWWYWIYDILFCLIMIGFMIFTFFKIINYSRMLATQELSRKDIIRLGICFGTEILSNFMIIFMYILQFLARRKD